MPRPNDMMVENGFPVTLELDLLSDADAVLRLARCAQMECDATCLACPSIRPIEAPVRQ
jgi:hypothetical protein